MRTSCFATVDCGVCRSARLRSTDARMLSSVSFCATASSCSRREQEHRVGDDAVDHRERVRQPPGHALDALRTCRAPRRSGRAAGSTSPVRCPSGTRRRSTWKSSVPVSLSSSRNSFTSRLPRGMRLRTSGSRRRRVAASARQQHDGQRDERARARGRRRSRSVMRSSSRPITRVAPGHPLQHVLRHRLGQLVLAHEHLAGVLLAQHRPPLRRCACAGRSGSFGFSLRATSIIFRTPTVSGVAITSIAARATCA